MSLYVKLQINFWTHRKTMRLKAIIGNDAFWAPIRLWSYAAENQPDGDFSDYQPEELGMLLGYASNASSIVQAMQQVGFMDEMKVHNWEEHNEYHHTFSERAKKAAKARWDKASPEDKTRDDKTRQDKSKQCLSIATSNASSINGSYSTDFDAFWSEYPKKIGKGEAWKSWKKIRPDDALSSKMVVAVRFQRDCQQWKKDNGQFIPNPATWLNQRRWEDEGLTVKTESLKDDPFWKK